jgi:tetratricopeptide (TPR) repeat protein
MRMRALMAAGLLAQWQADLDRAEVLLAEALTIARALADRPHEAEVLTWQASACWQEQADERGLGLCEQSLGLAHDLADERLIAFAQFNLGVGLRFARQTARAVTVLDESLRRYRTLGDVRYIAITSAMLGWATYEAGQFDRAAVILHDALRDLRAVGDQRFIRSSIRALAQIAHRQGRAGRAVRLFSAGEAMRVSLGMRQTERERAGSERLLAALREKLPTPDFEAAYAAGEAMSLDEVLAEIAPDR